MNFNKITILLISILQTTDKSTITKHQNNEIDNQDILGHVESTKTSNASNSYNYRIDKSIKYPSNIANLTRSKTSDVTKSEKSILTIF